MNYLDIILICLIGVFALRGFFRGLVQEVISLTSILLALYLSSTFHHLLVPHLGLYIENSVTVSALAYAIIFFGTLLVCWLIAKAIRTMLKITLLGWVDRVTGAVFGIIEGVLIGIVILIAFQSFAPESEWYTESKIAPRAQHVMKLVGDMAPESMQKLFESTGLELPTRDDIINTAQNVLEDSPSRQ